jgi:hypothetical protein
MRSRRLACVVLIALGGCPTAPSDGPSRFDPPLVVAKTGYCPELIESCPADSHPVTGVRAVMECDDPKNTLPDGWTQDPRAENYRIPHIVGKCLQQGDCLVFCRLSQTCQATEVTPTTVTCKPPVCGAENCERDLGERHRCDLPGSPTYCYECPADCPTECADGILEPGENCDPCEPGTTRCDGDLAQRCRDDGIGFETVQMCGANGLECRLGALGYTCNSACGNGRCGTGETSNNCPVDCACSGNQSKCLGDDLFYCISGTWTFQQDCTTTPGQVCQTFGTASTCFIPDICGNGTCEPATAGETTATCPADCP